MTSLIDTFDGREQLQTALQLKGFYTGPIDGDLGQLSRKAIIAARVFYNLPHQTEPVYDVALEGKLGLLAIQSPAVQSFGLDVLSFIINQALRGTGVNMDFAKISKAIAGGISGLLATTGTMAVIYFNLPPADVSHFPSFIYSIVPYVNEALGFAIGFCTVYFAPPNKG